MRTRLRGGRELLGMGLLFGLFLAFAIYSERIADETTPAATPSMHNAKSGGVKALNLLLEQQGYRVGDLRSSWNALEANDGLLIAVEPFDSKRPVDADELQALSRWVKDGGNLLYLVAAPQRPFDPKDALTGDVAVVGAENKELMEITPSPSGTNELLLQGVGTLQMGGEVRLQAKPGSPYREILRDSQGSLILEKAFGKGKLWAVASTSLATNAGIQESDNAVLLVNAASLAVGETKKTVLFDEYHHGIGLLAASGGERSIRAVTPLGVKLVVLHCVMLAVLLVYNGNRLFGKPLHVAVPKYRANTDYVGGLARLYRKAEATDIALSAMHQSFVRELTASLMLTPDAPMEVIAERARQRCAIDSNALLYLLTIGRSAQAGHRVSPAEMVRLAEQYEILRRKLDLAGNG